MNYFGALVLFFTPAVSVELLTGDTPIATYFDPIVFVVLNITYGGALLLMRETVVRWGKGFSAILILATGYGMLNEALCTKGFFDPHFYALIPSGLEDFGRVFHINVPWALNISIFHAIFSMIVPLVIVSAIFSTSGRWIGNKLYIMLLIALVADTIFSFVQIALPPSYYRYDEGLGPITIIFVLMALVIFSAWKIPSISMEKWSINLNASVLFVIGIIFFWSFALLPGRVQAATGSPGVYELFLLAVFVAVPVLLILKLAEPTSRGKVALAAGLVAPIPLTTSLSSAGVALAAIYVMALIAAAFFHATRSDWLLSR
jgi:hypothetical protein